MFINNAKDLDLALYQAMTRVKKYHPSRLCVTEFSQRAMQCVEVIRLRGSAKQYKNIVQKALDIKNIIAEKETHKKGYYFTDKNHQVFKDFYRMAERLIMYCDKPIRQIDVETAVVIVERVYASETIEE